MAMVNQGEGVCDMPPGVGRGRRWVHKGLTRLQPLVLGTSEVSLLNFPHVTWAGDLFGQ